MSFLRFTLRRNYQESDDDLFQALMKKGKGPKDTPRQPEERSDEEEAGDTKGKERNRFLESETKLLEKWFDKNPYPNKDERTLISEIMNFPEKKVRIWFQNKRCKTDDGKMKCFFARNNISTSDSGMEEDDLHTCGTCSQTFVSKLDFKIHCKRVHGTDGEKIVCKDCLMTFDSLWNLKTHSIEEHTKTGNREIIREELSLLTSPPSPMTFKGF